MMCLRPAFWLLNADASLATKIYRSSGDRRQNIQEHPWQAGNPWQHFLFFEPMVSLVFICHRVATVCLGLTAKGAKGSAKDEKEIREAFRVGGFS